jgi:hypothetical protein
MLNASEAVGLEMKVENPGMRVPEERYLLGHWGLLLEGPPVV